MIQMILDVFDGLLSVQGAAAMGVGAGAGILITKKIEHSPNLQAKIDAALARAGGKVNEMKEKVHPTTTEPSVADIKKIIATLPKEQQDLAMRFMAQAQQG